MTAVVDVVVPFHGNAEWLLQACTSLQRQTMPNWRALLINDGSNIEAGEVARKLSQYDPRFELVHQLQAKPTNGPWLARNLGISIACAPLVAFLDADDIWHPQKLEYQLPLHQGLGGARTLSVCAYHRFLDSSNQVLQTRIPPGTMSFNRLLRRNHIPLSSVILDRKLLYGIQTFQPEHHEDYGLWLRLFARKNPPIYRCLQIPLMAYRLHSNSMSARRHRSIFAVNRLFRQYLPHRRQRWPALILWGIENGWISLSKQEALELPSSFRSNHDLARAY